MCFLFGNLGSRVFLSLFRIKQNSNDTNQVYLDFSQTNYEANKLWCRPMYTCTFTSATRQVYVLSLVTGSVHHNTLASRHKL